jgi:hypothetical protein
MRWPAALAVLAGAIACSLAGSLAGCADAADRPATWSYLHAAIIAPACTTAGCHSKLAATAGLDLSDREGAYNLLVGRVCGQPERPQDPGRNYVTPGSAAYSQLVHQLRGEDGEGRAVRAAMPPDTRLPEVEVELVERWIDAGAACD